MVRVFIFFLILNSFVLNSFAENRADITAYKKGKKDALLINKEIGNVGGIEKNISKPMSSDEKMKTFGTDSAEFDANISPKNTKKFLELFMFPGGNGDLTRLLIKQDTNLDGEKDYHYEVNNVSGICTNGYISCDTGTWNNCSGYKWTTSGSSIKVINKQSSIINELKNCYCINKSCGSNLAFSNQKTVLTSLGQGIIGAIQTVNPHIAVTNSSFSDLSIIYSGLLSDLPLGTGGNMGIYTSGSETPEKLYKGASANNNISEVEKEKMRNTTLYEDISDVESNLNDPHTQQSCVITRDIGFNLEGLPFLIIKNNCKDKDLTGCSPESQKVCNSDNHCVYTIENSSTTGLSPLASSKNFKSPKGVVWTVLVNGYQLKAVNTISGESVILENSNEAWWLVETIYTCKDSELKKNIKEQKDIVENVDAINKTVVVNTEQTAMTYKDFGGNQKGSSLPYGEAPDKNCVPVCEVKIVLPMNDIVSDQKGTDSDGNPIYEDAGRWENSNNTIKEQVFVKTCIQDSCPVDSDGKEVMVKGCACRNEFTNAVTAINIANELKDDMICSDE